MGSWRIGHDWVTNAFIFHDPAIPLLGIYLKEIMGQKDTWTPVFTVYIHTHTHIHTMENYSSVKKNEIIPFAATWMDLEIITLNEVRQRKTNVWYCLHVGSKKKWYNWSYLWNRNRLTDLENEPIVTEGKGQIGSLGLTHTHCYVENRWPTRTNWTKQATVRYSIIT